MPYVHYRKKECTYCTLFFPDNVCTVHTYVRSHLGMMFAISRLELEHHVHAIKCRVNCYLFCFHVSVKIYF